MRSVAIATWFMCALAALVWVGAFFFSGLIGAQQSAIVLKLQKGESLASQRASYSASVALAGATANARNKLKADINRDVPTLSNLITEAGQNAGIPITVVNVTPGPGPSLPKGSVLHPSSYIFSVKTSGTYAQVLTAVSLLEALPAASTLESIQISSGETPGSWNAVVTVGIITGNSVSS